MVQPSDTNEYALGSAEAERERLIRQAAGCPFIQNAFFVALASVPDNAFSISARG
jgi:hypothetical protein